MPKALIFASTLAAGILRIHGGRNALSRSEIHYVSVAAQTLSSFLDGYTPKNKKDKDRADICDHRALAAALTDGQAEVDAWGVSLQPLPWENRVDCLVRAGTLADETGASHLRNAALRALGGHLPLDQRLACLSECLRKADKAGTRDLATRKNDFLAEVAQEFLRLAGSHRESVEQLAADLKNPALKTLLLAGTPGNNDGTPVVPTPKA